VRSVRREQCSETCLIVALCLMRMVRSRSLHTGFKMAI
jgi:hypothetical protein